MKYPYERKENTASDFISHILIELKSKRLLQRLIKRRENTSINIINTSIKIIKTSNI